MLGKIYTRPFFDKTAHGLFLYVRPFAGLLWASH